MGGMLYVGRPTWRRLSVVAARIDHAHHANTARRALEETVSLDSAVERAMTLVNTDDTLVIVTADHSHPLSIASYATRGNPITGEGGRGGGGGGSDGGTR